MLHPVKKAIGIIFSRVHHIFKSFSVGYQNILKLEFAAKARKCPIKVFQTDLLIEKETVRKFGTNTFVLSLHLDNLAECSRGLIEPAKMIHR